MKADIEGIVDSETVDVKLTPSSSAEKALTVSILRRRIEASIDEDGVLTISFYPGGRR